MPLKLTTFFARPDHLAEFCKIAKAQGLSMGSLIRVLIAKEVRKQRRAK